ncbi:hypothetical protein V502_08449 [Pseudogymnoascus sp. VKM F-4520 (FW-2644)]|nr:hypothetical protein V502_08449 [Pseudogymnoascus sp. VKM F-4520 (FW-2644)]
MATQAGETAVELEQYRQSSSPTPAQTPKTINHPTELPSSANTSYFDPADPDNVVLASLLADSQVPDGGYGWVVVFACSVLCFWFVGTTYSWGVIQAALVKQNLSSPATLSFVGSLTWAGARNTALAGITLFGGGQILSGFTAHSVPGLFVTMGVIMGMGVSNLFMVVSVTPAQYFSKKRGIANGIVYAGGGLGGTVISFAMDALIRKLGIVWTFRVLGIAMLVTGLPAAWLIKERAPIKTTTFIEWNLFRSFKFTVLFLTGVVATFPLFVPPFFLPLYSTSLGLSPSAGAGLVAGFNFSSAVGRLACGFMSDRFGPLNTLLLSLVLSSVSMLALWPVSTTLGPLIVFVIINGTGNGGFFSTIPTVVGSVFGSARVSVAMGMMVSGWAGGYLMGAPIAGYLLAAYGGEHSTLKAYHPAIFYAGSMALGASILAATVRLNVNRKILAIL